MNLAVLLYSEVIDKPEGIPDAWPAQVKELGESTTLPGAEWVLQTKAEFEAYKEDHAQEYEDWASGLEQPPIVIIKNTLDAHKDFGKKIYESAPVEKKEVLIRFQTNEIQPALLSGSLYLALKKMSKVEVDDYLNNDILLSVGNPVREFLGLEVVADSAQLADGL